MGLFYFPVFGKLNTNTLPPRKKQRMIFVSTWTKRPFVGTYSKTICLLASRIFVFMRLMGIRYSLRSLARDPAFACVTILVLSLGIAINTIIFSVIDQFVLNPLPYKDPSHLLMIWESNPSLGEPAGSRVPAAWSNFAEWRNQSKSFQAIEAFEPASYNLTGRSEPEHVTAARATGGYFQMLGTNAERGRTFTPEDSRPRAVPVAIITNTFEEAHFADKDALGQKLILDGVPYIIVGVLPKNFHLPLLLRGSYEYKPAVWVPIPELTSADRSKYRRLFVSARLKHNASLTQARTEMLAIAKRLQQADPELNENYSTNLVPLEIENADPDFERALYILWAGGLGVLLLGCANLAGLMSVRAISKQRDLAIMKALGAPTSALIANVLTEGILLAIAAFLLAVLASYAGVRWIDTAKPGDLAGAERLGLNIKALLFAGCTFICCIVVFALLPAWLSTRQPLNAALKSARMAPGKDIGVIIRRALLSGEVAVALALAIGAMLLVRSFTKLLDVDPGFRAENVLTARIVLAPPYYTGNDARRRFCDELLNNLREEPMTESASLVDNFPLSSIRYTFFEIEGRPLPQSATPLTADYANVTSDFFRTIGTPLRRGRLFVPEDMQEGAEQVVIVNETMASKFWPNHDAVDTHLRVVLPHRPPEPWRRVIGVVGDFRQFNIDTPPRPEMFWPARQFSDLTLVVRTKENTGATLREVRQAVANIDKQQPISDIQTLQQMVDHSIAQRRFNTYLLGVFAGLSIILAMLGVYGLLSYVIAFHNRDIGIRLALGAQRLDIGRFLIGAMLPFAITGIALGVLLSFLLKAVIAHLLFGINALDPITYASVPAVMALVIVSACLHPSRRAIRIAPAEALRHY